MTPQDFLKLAIPAAQTAQKATGIPASITIAQCFLETGYGNHMPPGSNNPFGIKATAGQACVTAMTVEYKDGQCLHLPQNFAKYPTWGDSFTARSKMILTRPWFAQALRFKDDAAKFIVALQSGKDSHGDPMPYSTSKEYADGIMHLVHQYDLLKYDSTQAV